MRVTRGSGGFRPVGLVLAAVLAVAAAMGALRWVDVASTWVAVLQALFPVAGAGIVAVTLLALVCRHPRLALVGAAPSAVVLVLAGATLLPQTVPPRADDLTVVSANLNFGGADAAALVREVTTRHTDVLVLLEVTPESVTRLRDAGLDAALPEVAGTAAPGARGTLVRSRFPLTLLDDADTEGFGQRQPEVRVERPGHPFVLKAAHPLQPVQFVESWRGSLAALSRWKDAQPAGERFVIAGDLNASAAHPAYRELADGLTDAHRAAGLGWVRTWPYGRRLPPFVQLDHVLSRGFEVVGAGTVVVGDTDHAAVWATLR